MKKIISILTASILLAVLCVPAFAAVVPSIEVKPAPEVVDIKVEGDPTPYSAVIFDDDGETGVAGYDEGGSSTILEFYLISTAEKDSAILSDMTDGLTAAEEQIKSTDNIGNLGEGLGAKLDQKLDDFYKGADDRATVQDLVISDLFLAALVRDKTAVEAIEEGKEVKFMIKPTLFTEDDFFALLHSEDGTDWDVVENVEWTDDGCLVITVDALWSFAIVLEKSVAIPDGPDGPQTDIGMFFRFEYAVIAVLALGAAVVVAVNARRAKEG